MTTLPTDTQTLATLIMTDTRDSHDICRDVLSADVIYALVSGIHRLAVCHTTCCHGYCIRLPNLENHNVYVYQLLQVHRQRILNNKFLVYILCDKHFLPRPPSNCAMCKVQSAAQDCEDGRPRITKMAGPGLHRSGT